MQRTKCVECHFKWITYGNYEWRNWTDKCVVGWRPIENTT